MSLYPFSLRLLISALEGLTVHWCWGLNCDDMCPMCPMCPSDDMMMPQPQYLWTESYRREMGSLQM